MRIAAFDVGTKYIGIALSDESCLISQPFISYKRKTLKNDLIFFDDFVKRYNIKKIIIGYPVYMDGTESQMTLFVKKFFYKLRYRWKDVEVILWDERMTTEESEKILSEFKPKLKKNKAIKDKISAALILKSYLETSGAF